MNDDPLEALDAEASVGIYATSHDALHGWIAVTQLPHMLGMAQVIEQVRPECGTFNDVPWVMERMAEFEVASDDGYAFIDKMGDASKVLLAALQVELTAKGMGNAQFFVFLPCHGGYGLVAFSNDHGPAVRVF